MTSSYRLDGIHQSTGRHSVRTQQGSQHKWISSLSGYKPLKTIMVNIFNTVKRAFFRGTKELKEEEGSEIFLGSPKNRTTNEGGC